MLTAGGTYEHCPPYKKCRKDVGKQKFTHW